MKDKKTGIAWKMIMYILAFLAVGCILIYLFHASFKNSIYEHLKQKDIKSAYSYIEQKLLSEGIDGLESDEDMQAMLHEGGICAAVYDKDGNMLFSYDAVPFCVLHKYTKSDIERIYKKTQQDGKYISYKDADFFEFRPNDNIVPKDEKTSQQPFGQPDEQPQNNSSSKRNVHKEEKVKTIVYSRIENVNGEPYMIILNSSIHPTGVAGQLLGIEAVYVCIVLVLFSALLAFVMYRKISRPIMLTNQKALLLAKGDYTVQFDMVGYKEIDQLNSTLNYAAGELRKTEELRNELMANISHDLRTPLTMIRGCAELMRDIPGECNEENINVIINESSRLSNLVTDILDLSKMQSGVTALEISEFSLTDLVSDVVKGYSKMLSDENEKIEFKFDREVFVEADCLKISRVVHNLISNAINYSPKDEKVVVMQTAENNKVRIDVKDKGAGIDEKDIPLIWERYYKVDKNRKRKSHGTGLGLSIVKNILEMHKAEYGVISKKGEGSDFYFILDIKSEE